MTDQDKRAFTEKWLSAWTYSTGEIETLYRALDLVSPAKADDAMRRLIALKEDRMRIPVGAIIRELGEGRPSALSAIPGDGDMEWNHALMEWIEAACRYGPNAQTPNAKKIAEAWCAWVDYHRAKCGVRYTDEYRRQNEDRARLYLARLYLERAEAEATIATAQPASNRTVKELPF